MNEKEIEKLIVDALAMEVWSTIKKRSVYQVRGDWGQGAKEAAHAITKKWAEGVRWKGPGKMNAHRAIELLSPASGEVYGMFSPWPPGKLLDTPIHQRVTVTVTKEEGDG